MIATVRGNVAAVALDSAVVEVGGVGILVHAAPGTLAELTPGQPGQLFTSLVVREDSLTLYGFLTDDERSTFELVQTVSGIGPRLALAMLAVLAPDGLRRAVASDDLVALTRVPGHRAQGRPAAGPGAQGPARAARRGRRGRAAPARCAGRRPAAGARRAGRSRLVGQGRRRRARPGAGRRRRGAAPPDVAALLRAALRLLGRT